MTVQGKVERILDGEVILFNGVPFRNTWDVVEVSKRRHPCYSPCSHIGKPQCPVLIRVGDTLEELVMDKTPEV